MAKELAEASELAAHSSWRWPPTAPPTKLNSLSVTSFVRSTGGRFTRSIKRGSNYAGSSRIGQFSCSSRKWDGRVSQDAKELVARAARSAEGLEGATT